MTTLDKKGQSITIDSNKKSDKNKSPLDILFYRDFDKIDAIILKAMTGSGKSTSLPVYMLNKYKDAKIAITQPRIVNVNSIRERTRDLTRNESLIGSITGQESNKSGNERLMIYTEAAYDVENKDDWVIIDEAHERTGSVDLLLANLIEQTPRKKLIITSATIDPEDYSKYLKENGLKYIIAEVEGVKPIYNNPIFLAENVDNYVEKAADIIINDIRRDNTDKRNIIVFLPSVATIKMLSGILSFKINDTENIVELYRGNIDVDDIIDRKKGISNIILATNVAETGITIDNLKYVIDSGWTNKGYYNPESNVDMLLKERITEANATQRWGRSGRSRDEKGNIINGVIYCLYTEDFYTREIKGYKELPSVMTGNVDRLVLEKINKVNLKLMDDIPPQSRERSIENLYLLWAIDDKRKITELGKMILDVRLDPRWAKIILAGVANDCLYPVMACISFIMEGVDKNAFPRVLNDKFSDHWEYWLIFKKYFRSTDSFEMNNVVSRFKLIAKSLERIGFNVHNVNEDNKDNNNLWSRFKQALYSGLYMNMARRSDIDHSVYISNMNPEVIGKVGSSNMFNMAAKDLFPKKIVFDSVILKYNSVGQAQYTFTNCTVADN